MFKLRARVLLAILALVSAATTLAPAAPARADQYTHAAGKMYVVTVLPGHGDDVWPNLPSAGARYYEPIGTDNALVVIPQYDTAPVLALRYVTAVSPLVASANPDETRPWTQHYDPIGDAGSLWNVAQTIHADDYWKRGVFGQGVDVAVIDTGVARLPDFGDRLINGPDLSFDAAREVQGGDPNLDGMDAYGHGTHIAGIIAARPVLLTDKFMNPAQVIAAAKRDLVGIAPASRIVNVRTGAADGTVDVSQMIAAMEWVIQHRDDKKIGGGLHIRVLNLSYGTDGGADLAHDPFDAELERVWRAGIVPVVSAGNSGYSATKRLDDPAVDPYTLAVGASDSRGTLKPTDDAVAEFTSRGNGGRTVDVLAPGASITSLAVPGSMIDQTFPSPRVGTDVAGAKYFKGSGTSQAAAVVSGAAALLMSDPSFTKTIFDGRHNPAGVVKALLAHSTIKLQAPARNMRPLDKSLGLLDLGRAHNTLAHVLTGQWTQSAQDSLVLPHSSNGSRGGLLLANTRGTFIVSYTDETGEHYLNDEHTVSGLKWRGFVSDTTGWSVSGVTGPTGPAWTNEVMDGHNWIGGDWLGRTWRASAWSGRTWRESIWSGRTWRDGAWRLSSDG